MMCFPRVVNLKRRVPASERCRAVFQDTQVKLAGPPRYREQEQSAVPTPVPVPVSVSATAHVEPACGRAPANSIVAKKKGWQVLSVHLDEGPVYREQ